MEKIFSPSKSIESIVDALWTPALEFYTTYSAAYLRPIVKELIAYIDVSPTTKTNNVYVKYKTAKHSEMALVCERHVHILKQMAEQD